MRIVVCEDDMIMHNRRSSLPPKSMAGRSKDRVFVRGIRRDNGRCHLFE